MSQSRGRPDSAGRTGLDRIDARTFGFWGGQTGAEPPNLGAAGPPQALNLGIPHGMMRIRVVVFPPEYVPETIDADVRIGCSVDEALRAVQTRRTEWRRRVFPVLVPVHPQPASGYAVALALPDWCQDRYVLMDCLRVERAMSCALCSEVTTRTSLLEVAGLAPGTGLEVYVHERAAPLGEGDAIGISTGFCITFVPQQHPPFAVASFEDMLRDPLSWDQNAGLPGVLDRWVYLLTDDEPFPALPSPQRTLPARLEYAALLDYDPARIVFQPSYPAIRDHYDRGVLADTVIIVSQEVLSDAEHVLYVLDMRPVLCGLTWGVARFGRVRTRPILDRFRRLCPPGARPDLQGGQAEPAGYPSCLRVEPGNVLTISFVPDDGSDDNGFSDSSMDAGAGAPDGSDDEDESPRHPGHNQQHAQEDAATAGTSSGSDPAPTERSRSPRGRPLEQKCRGALWASAGPFWCAAGASRYDWVEVEMSIWGLLLVALVLGPLRFTPFLAWPVFRSFCGHSQRPACHTQLLRIMLFLVCLVPSAAAPIAPCRTAHMDARNQPDSSSLQSSPRQLAAALPGLRRKDDYYRERRLDPDKWTRRPLPTPCRAPCLMPPRSETTCLEGGTVQLGGRSSDGVRGISGQQGEKLYTLLAEAASRVDCSAFAVAVALLEVLTEAFPRAEAEPEHGEAPREEQRHGATTLVLAEHVPIRRPGLFCFPTFDCANWGADPAAADPVRIGTTDLGFSFADCQSFLGAQPLGAPWPQVCESFGPQLAPWDAKLRAFLGHLGANAGPSDVWVYTDGSYTRKGACSPSRLGWACLFLHPASNQIFCSWGGVLRQLESDADVSAVEGSAYVAECAGLLAAGLIAVSSLGQAHLRYLSDCQAALCAAAGHLQQEATGITAALIAVQALRRHAVPRAQVYEYVPGHSGVVPNEIADVLSKIAASADVSSCGLQVPDLTAVSWLGCGANKLAWVSVALRSCLGNVSMPPINQQDLGHDCYHAGLSTADLFAPFTPSEVQLPHPGSWLAHAAGPCCHSCRAA